MEPRRGPLPVRRIRAVPNSNVFGRVMGSTTQNLSRLSPCSVLIVK
jgi:nucleotide-binding universal stress UspA family protein